MIDREIAALVPEVKAGSRVDDDWDPSSGNLHHTFASTGSMSDYVHGSNSKNLQVLEGTLHGYAEEVHGRFEEITYRDDRGPPGHSDGVHHTDIRAQHESLSLRIIHCSDTQKMFEKLTVEDDDEKIITVDDQSQSSYSGRKSYYIKPESPALEDHENEIRRELRWLKAKYQMQLSGIKDQQLGDASPSSRPPRPNEIANHNRSILKSLTPEISLGSHRNLEGRCANAMASGSFSPEQMVTAKGFYTGTLLPQPLNRATSLPVDAVEF